MVMTNDYAKDYTIKELIASFISNTLEDGLTVSVGAGIPMARAGILLAHLTHGPNMKVSISMVRTNLIHEPVLEPFEFGTDYRGTSKYGEAYLIHDESFDDLKFRRNLVFFCGGLQVDKFGNTNLIGIGKDRRRWKFRGPGGIGERNSGAVKSRMRASRPGPTGTDMLPSDLSTV